MINFFYKSRWSSAARCFYNDYYINQSKKAFT
nr:MAG TPA: hypothetical protein [Caudoviricetes sp.]